MNHYNGNEPPETDAAGNIFSWIIVFVMMIAFLPIGLLLLFRQLRKQAKAQENQREYSGGYYSQTAQYSAHDPGAAAREAAARAAEAARKSGNAVRNVVRESGNAIRDVARESGNAVRNVAREAGAVVRETGAAARETGNTVRQTSPQYVDYRKQTVPGTYVNATTTHRPPPAPIIKPQKTKRRNRLEKKTGKFISTLMLLLSIPLFILGVTGIASSAQTFQSVGGGDWTGLILAASSLAGAFALFFSRNIRKRRYTRYKNYYAYAAGRDMAYIADIARAAGVSAKTVARDVQTMISNGYFAPGAYFDYELNSLVLNPEAAKAARQTARTASAERNPPPAPAQTQYNPHFEVINELRELKVSIADIIISEKVGHIEEVTAKIFRLIEEKPEKQAQMRRFDDYYLPTTLKLLHSYATLEKQGIKGENIMSAKENIGRILDTLATGFEQQLDQLFKLDALDIAADITVLENLMQQDGLTADKPELKVMESST
ncbi:MAG: 5-bromo-4-chloroindolyl phosphate hydrolysis family protein [Oscillospiraceae bacterium]|nr:5-bromo-4-chloroindolyl phosphate hydrolysis family protein [Oscillospiraceae bacterium]